MQHNNFSKDIELLSEAYSTIENKRQQLNEIIGPWGAAGLGALGAMAASDEEADDNVEVDIEVEERQTNKINVTKQDVIQNIRTSYNSDARQHLGEDLIGGDCSYIPCYILAFVHYDGTFLEDAYNSWENYTKGINEVVDTGITADIRATYKDILQETAHYIKKAVLADTTDEFLELTEHISPNVLFSDEVVAEVAQVAASEPGETELQVVDQATGEVFARIPAKVLAAVNVDDY